MSRSLSIVTSPEAVLAALTAVVFLFCARHMSYGTEDVQALERLVWLLPLIAVPLGFVTLRWTGDHTWSWLVRVNLALLTCLVVCGFRIVEGFGLPGSGPKGQDAGLILIVSLGVTFGAVGNAICGATILRAQHPVIAKWFKTHTMAGPIFTALATIPLFAVQAVATGLILGVLVTVFTAFTG